MKSVCNNPLLLTPDGASVSSYSIKSFIDFDSSLLQQANASYCRLWMCTLLFLCPSICCCYFCVVIALVPSTLVKIKQPINFFLTTLLTLFVPLEISSVVDSTQQPIFIKPVKTSGVYSSRTSHLRRIPDCLPSFL